MGRGYFTPSSSTGAKVCNISCRYSQKSIFFQQIINFLSIIDIQIIFKSNITYFFSTNSSKIAYFIHNRHFFVRQLAHKKAAENIRCQNLFSKPRYYLFWYISTGVGDSKQPLRVLPENTTSNIRCSSEAAISTSTTRAARKVILQSCNS